MSKLIVVVVVNVVFVDDVDVVVNIVVVKLFLDFILIDSKDL